MTVLDTLLGLAPNDLRARNTARYDGDGLALTLAAFAPEDRRLLFELYRAVKEFHLSWLTVPDALAQLVGDLDAGWFVRTGRELGRATERESRSTPAVQKVLHDVRGGALTLLAGTAELVRLVPDPGPLLATCGYAARDHVKIMRNAVSDLDPTARARDKEHRLHCVDGVLAPWRGPSSRVEGRDVRIEVRTLYTGGVAGSCLETAAVDRVVYNLINNAARFAADGRIALSVLGAGHGLTRWVVSNAVTAEERQWLGGSDLRRLYRDGVTHGGTGTGLANCADIVAAGCGLPSGRVAVEGGYLGARVIGEEFYSWFHWPVVEHSP